MNVRIVPADLRPIAGLDGKCMAFNTKHEAESVCATLKPYRESNCYVDGTTHDVTGFRVEHNLVTNKWLVLANATWQHGRWEPHAVSDYLSQMRLAEWAQRRNERGI